MGGLDAAQMAAAGEAIGAHARNPGARDAVGAVAPDVLRGGAEALGREEDESHGMGPAARHLLGRIAVGEEGRQARDLQGKPHAGLRAARGDGAGGVAQGPQQLYRPGDGRERRLVNRADPGLEILAKVSGIVRPVSRCKVAAMSRSDWPRKRSRIPASPGQAGRSPPASGRWRSGTGPRCRQGSRRVEDDRISSGGFHRATSTFTPRFSKAEASASRSRRR